MVKIFVTGITGLVGSAFCTELLRRRDDIQITALARSNPKMNLTAYQYVEQSVHEQCKFDGYLDQAERLMKRITVHEGDVTNAATFPELEEFRTFDTVFHCAADVNLGKDPDGRTFNINFNGTKNVLSLAEQAGVKAFHYVSTAYVCGTHQGVAMEDQLVAVDFFNSYEKSKFEAEKLVRKSTIPFSIYRPSIIVGRQGDGKIRKPLAFYRLLEFLGKLKRNICYKNKLDFSAAVEFPLRMEAELSNSIYFVPVDYVQDTITSLFMKPVECKTYHVTGHTEIKTVDIKKTIIETLKVKGLEVSSEVKDKTPLEELFHRFASDLLPYFASKVVFDQTNVENALGAKVLDWRMDYDKLNLIIKSYYQDYFGLSQ